MIMKKTLQTLIDNSKNIVFFGGAGVSTESGIPDFRSQDGLYHQQYKYPPEQILSHTFFVNQSVDFYEFYRKKILCCGSDFVPQPNAAHLKLAELEQCGKLSAVITQNIDGLHQLAGSKKVYELHGSIKRNYCMNCGKFYNEQIIIDTTEVPHCECGGIIKPDVVLYEEPLDDAIVTGSLNALEAADLLIIGGTSLNVYPAAGLIRYYGGSEIVLINKGETSIDDKVTLLINDSIGSVLSKIDLP